MENQSLALIGAIAGPIGALTGIAGAIISWRSYRLAHQIKQTDLRLELRRAQSDIAASLDEIEGLIQRSLRSRTGVLSAAGMANSSVMERFKRRIEEAGALLGELSRDHKAKMRVLDERRETNLEPALSNAYQMQRKLQSLREEFESNLRDDNEELARLSNARH